MTDRSLFPRGVKVDSQDLGFEVTQRVAHTLRRFSALAPSGGIVSGGSVAAGSVTGTATVQPLTGYTPNGEYISVSSVQSNVPMADSTNGVENFLVAFYTEVEDTAGAHVSDGTAPPRRARGSFRLLAVTSDEIAALDATNDDLSVNALDRMLTIAKVTAQGTGVSVAGFIEEPPTYVRVLTIDQPTSVTGVRILSVSDDTPLSDAPASNGAGTLAYDASSGLATWAAPGESAGAGEDITASGTYDLFSSGGSKIVVESFAPMVDTYSALTPSDSLSVFATYEPAAARVGAEDQLHRSQVGGLAPGAANTHGLASEGLGPIANFLSSVITGNGLLGGAWEAQVPRNYSETSTVSDRTLMGQWGGDNPAAEAQVRMYVTNSGVWELTVNARWEETGTPHWEKDVTGAGASKLLLDGADFRVFFRDAATGGTWIDSGWSETNFASIAGLVSLILGRVVVGSGLLGTAIIAETPRVQIDVHDVGPRTELFFSEQLGGFLGSELRIFRAVSSGAGLSWTLEFVFNARWSNSTLLWTSDTTGVNAVKLEIAQDGLRLYKKTAPIAGTWADTSWDATLLSSNLDPTKALLSLTADTLTTTGDVTVGDDLIVNDDASVGGITTATGGIIVGATTATLTSGGAITGTSLTASSSGAITGGTLALSTNAPGGPAQNTLYANTMSKAYGSIFWTGSPTVGGIDDDFNVSSVDINGTGATSSLTVNLTTGMADENYVVVLQNTDEVDYFENTDPMQSGIKLYNVTSKSSTSFNIIGWVLYGSLAATPALRRIEFDAQDWHIDFVIFSRQ